MASFPAWKPSYTLAWMLAQYGINKLLSYTVFSVTGNKATEERVYICRQPDLEWSKAFLSLLLCFEVTKNTLMPVVGTCQCSEKSPISAKHCGLRPSIRARDMIIHNPREREREREIERERWRETKREREKNHWLSCHPVTFGISHTTCIARCHLFIK